MKTRTKNSWKNGGFFPASVLSLLVVFLTITSCASAQFINPGYPSVQPLGPRYQPNGFGPSMPFFFLNGPGIVGNGYVETLGTNNSQTPNDNATLPRTTDSIDASIDKNDQLVVRWSGEPRAVRRVIVALLDKDRKSLKRETITRLPVQARLSLTSKTSYYQVVIEYVNGTSTSIVSPL